MKDDIKVKKVRSEFENFKLKPVVQYVEEDEEKRTMIGREKMMLWT